MKNQVAFRLVPFCFLLAAVLLAGDVAAQQSPARRGMIYGDWHVKMDFSGMQVESILSLSRDREGNRTGQWISFWGISELKDITYENGQLSFVRERQNREGQTITSKFKGTIADGKLSGTLSGERGETKLEGTRGPRMPRAVGSWELKFKVGEREITNTLEVQAGKEGELAVQWQSERVEHKISDVNYERGTLSFKSQSKMQDRQWESTFNGTIEEDTLSGTLKSERGEMAVEGKRMGAPLIGTWNLEITSERGTRKQRLRVNRDMSGLFGAIAIKKVEFQDGKVSFKRVIEFGDQKFEMNFQGAIEDSKLTGELSSSRGTQKVAGTKVTRRFRRGGTI